MTWRDKYRPLIARVIAANKDPAKLRAELRAAFPSGTRNYHPYKIWLDEIRLQLGLKADKQRKRGTKLPVKPAEGQQDLFVGKESGEVRK